MTYNTVADERISICSANQVDLTGIKKLAFVFQPKSTNAVDQIN